MENPQPLLHTMASGGICHGGGHNNGAWNAGGIITALRNDDGIAGQMSPPVNAPFDNYHYPLSSMPPQMQMQQKYQQMPQIRQPAQQYMRYQQQPVWQYQRQPTWQYQRQPQQQYQHQPHPQYHW
jgi:hypothetical protein